MIGLLVPRNRPCVKRRSHSGHVPGLWLLRLPVRGTTLSPWRKDAIGEPGRDPLPGLKKATLGGEPRPARRQDRSSRPARARSTRGREGTGLRWDLRVATRLSAPSSSFLGLAPPRSNRPGVSNSFTDLSSGGPREIARRDGRTSVARAPRDTRIRRLPHPGSLLPEEAHDIEGGSEHRVPLHRAEGWLQRRQL
jgi:hypothetical protein